MTPEEIRLLNGSLPKCLETKSLDCWCLVRGSKRLRHCRFASRCAPGGSRRREAQSLVPRSALFSHPSQRTASRGGRPRARQQGSAGAMAMDTAEGLELIRDGLSTAVSGARAVWTTRRRTRRNGVVWGRGSAWLHAGADTCSHRCRQRAACVELAALLGMHARVALCHRALSSLVFSVDHRHSRNEQV